MLVLAAIYLCPYNAQARSPLGELAQVLSEDDAKGLICRSTPLLDGGSSSSRVTCTAAVSPAQEPGVPSFSRIMRADGVCCAR